MPTDIKHEVPALACHLAGGEVTFAAAKASGNVPIRMLARSAQPVEHWWWGRVVHDMSGMRAKSSIPIDYEHFEPIGFLDKFDATNKGLFVEGELVPTGEPGDITGRLLKLSAGGVPYEASINFGGDGIKTEWLGEDQVAEVNGFTFEGPGVIIREWPLRGVAVCPYGEDANTNSRFHRDPNQVFHLSSKEAAMSKPTPAPATKLSDTGAVETPAAPATETTPATPAAPAEKKPAEETPGPAPTPAADALSAVRAEIKRFRTAFGDKGPVYFDDGLSFEDASARHVKELVEANTKLSAQVKELAEKLSKATGQPAGELTAVGFDAADAPKRNGFASKIRFAGAARA
ncbi:MAG TPA: hypothetical protein VIG92_03785 [Rhodospirillales bacterium]